MSRILPKPTPTSQAYWDGCQNQQLQLQQCNDCGHVQFYPRVICAACHSQELAWITASGAGTVASFSVMHQQMTQGYDTGQVVALIDLKEGPRMMSHVVGDNAEQVAVGDAVQVVFEAWSDDLNLPVFEKTEDIA